MLRVDGDITPLDDYGVLDSPRLKEMLWTLKAREVEIDDGWKKALGGVP